MASSNSEQRGPYKVAIIGTGFSGLGMASRLKQQGEHDFVIFEKEAGVGGTWRVNHYPGCACDVPSHLYSFSFEQNPGWSTMFARQPEIRDYLERCARKYDLHPHTRFNTEIRSLRWDEAAQLWQLTDRAGNEYRARLVVSGMGGLSTPAYPRIPGLERFAGRTFHSQQWDHDYDLRGKRVAVIGTGASAVQFVPQIQPEVARLDLYQRTPPWIIPKHDRKISALERWLFRSFPATQRLYRGAIWSALETRVLSFAVDPRFMAIPKRWALGQIRRQIKDPVLRRKVTPDYTIGCKRILISNDYYPALTRPNVDVITTGIQEIRPDGVATADGKLREADAIIFGTGFKAADPLPRGMVFGRDGRDLMDVWGDGLEGYKGTTVSGFPNMFFLMGPNTGLGHSSMVYMIESQIQYVLDALRTMDRQDIASIDVTPQAQQRFNDRVQRKLSGAVWQTGCQSWYLHPVSGKNGTLWPGFTWQFRRQTRRFDPAAYTLNPTSTAVGVYQHNSNKIMEESV